MASDDPKPWEQQRGEPAAAFKAFSAFRDLGPERTVVDAYRQTRRKPDARQADGTWNGWVGTWNWRGRTEDWDRHVESIRLAAEAKVLRKRADLWARRRADEVPEIEYGMASALVAEAARVIEGATVPGPDGTTPVRVPVTASDLRRAALVVLSASDLWRRSIELATNETTEPPRRDPRDFAPAVAWDAPGHPSVRFFERDLATGVERPIRNVSPRFVEVRLPDAVPGEEVVEVRRDEDEPEAPADAPPPPPALHPDPFASAMPPASPLGPVACPEPGDVIEWGGRASTVTAAGSPAPSRRGP